MNKKLSTDCECTLEKSQDEHCHLILKDHNYCAHLASIDHDWCWNKKKGPTRGAGKCIHCRKSLQVAFNIVRGKAHILHREEVIISGVSGTRGKKSEPS